MFASSNSYWWHEYKILQDDKGRRTEIYCRSFVCLICSFLPVINIIAFINFIVFTEGFKHGFKFKLPDKPDE